MLNSYLQLITYLFLSKRFMIIAHMTSKITTEEYNNYTNDLHIFIELRKTNTNLIKYFLFK